MICVNILGAIHNVQGIKPVIVYDTILSIAKSLVNGSLNSYLFICFKFLDWSYFKHFRYRQTLVCS